MASNSHFTVELSVPHPPYKVWADKVVEKKTPARNVEIRCFIMTLVFYVAILLQRYVFFVCFEHVFVFFYRHSFFLYGDRMS